MSRKGLGWLLEKLALFSTADRHKRHPRRAAGSRSCRPREQAKSGTDSNTAQAKSALWRLDSESLSRVHRKSIKVTENELLVLLWVRGLAKQGRAPQEFEVAGVWCVTLRG